MSPAPPHPSPAHRSHEEGLQSKAGPRKQKSRHRAPSGRRAPRGRPGPCSRPLPLPPPSPAYPTLAFAPSFLPGRIVILELPNGLGTALCSPPLHSHFHPLRIPTPKQKGSGGTYCPSPESSGMKAASFSLQTSKRGGILGLADHVLLYLIRPWPGQSDFPPGDVERNGAERKS